MINKLIIKETSFSITANIDERIKTRKNKLVIKEPNRIIIRPKPNGIILNQIRDTSVYKQDQGIKISVQQQNQNPVYKQMV